MRIPLLTLAAVVALTAKSVHAADLVLAANGKSDYQIVLPDTTPTPAVGEGLAQVARLVQTAFKAQGVDVPVIAEERRDRARPGIYLGNTAFAREQGVKIAELSGWGYIHRVIGRDVVIAGRDEPGPKPEPNSRSVTWDRIGTAKGAADFLRRYAGVRYLYPDLEPRTPIRAGAAIDLLATPAIEFLKTPTIAVPSDLNTRITPLLEFNTSYPPTGGFYDIANNRFPLVDTAFGGHTYERAVPTEKYRDTHPEYFALVGGKRLTEGVAQYCISNPEVRELIYQDLISTIDRGYHTVDLGQPDGFRPCQCEACTKLYDTGSDWSEKLWLFHRDLAERVHQARPGKTVTMMSYIQTAMPPKSFKTFPANTRVMLTGTNEEDIAPWRGHVVPGGFSSYVYNWCPNLGTRYTPMRTPGFVEEQARRLTRNRIKSVYRDGPGSLFGLEGPVYYTMGRMFDDPEGISAKELVHEFCGAAFGPAAGPMLQFYDQLYHGIELYARHLGTRDPAWTYRTIYGQSRKHLTDPFQFIGFLYTPRLMASLESLLAQAERINAPPKVKTRLALVRREFDYLQHMARVVHLTHAYETQPDRVSRDRLLDAIDARNAVIDSYFNARGHTNRVEGWAYVLFPPPGHDAKHMRLGYDGYQEPYAATPFNWDTKAMRTAPLLGAKRLPAILARGKIAIDSAEWNDAPAGDLGPLPPGSTATRPAKVRALYDTTHVYVRVECEQPGAEGGPNEAVAVYLAPADGKSVAYRFTVGLKPEAKQDAALGFVSDPIDPRYGKFDPDWTGPWTYEPKRDAAGNRWVVLITVPFKTLGVEAPQAGAVWRGNVARQHHAADGRIERSVWSATAGAKTADDPDQLGEIEFRPAKEAKPAANPLRQTRQDLYRKTFAEPAEWASR